MRDHDASRGSTPRLGQAQQVLQSAWQRATLLTVTTIVLLVFTHGLLVARIDDPGLLRGLFALTAIGFVAIVSIGLFGLRPLILAEASGQPSPMDLVQQVDRLDSQIHELERSNRELSEFAHVASHDLKRPLRTISSYLELLDRRHVDQPDSRIQDSGAEVEVDELPTVPGDRVALQQVFQNLVSNAIKFTNDDTRPHVRVTAERENGTWRVDVADNGVGFDAGTADRLFEIFERGPSAADEEGFGVGLSVVDRVVRRHGGEVTADSTLGKGPPSRFGCLPANTVTAKRYKTGRRSWSHGSKHLAGEQPVGRRDRHRVRVRGQSAHPAGSLDRGRARIAALRHLVVRDRRVPARHIGERGPGMDGRHVVESAPGPALREPVPGHARYLEPGLLPRLPVPRHAAGLRHRQRSLPGLLPRVALPADRVRSHDGRCQRVVC